MPPLVRRTSAWVSPSLNVSFKNLNYIIETASKGAANWKQGDDATHQTITSEVSTKPKAPQPDVMCGSHLKTSEDLTGFPTFPNGTKSLLKKHLSKELWAKYSD